MKKELSMIFVLGISALFITTMLTEAERLQKLEVEKEINTTLKALNKNLFPGLKDDELVVRVNEGGFLHSDINDAETTKKEFEELNEGVKCKIMTVAQAKEMYKKEFLASYGISLDK